MIVPNKIDAVVAYSSLVNFGEISFFGQLQQLGFNVSVSIVAFCLLVIASIDFSGNSLSVSCDVIWSFFSSDPGNNSRTVNNNLTKLTITSLAGSSSTAVKLTGAGSRRRLQLCHAWIFKLLSSLFVARVIEQFVCSGCFSGCVEVSSLPHPTLPSIVPFIDPGSVDGCLEWLLMAGLRRFASHGGGILSRGCLATVEVPGYPRYPPSSI